MCNRDWPLPCAILTRLFQCKATQDADDHFFSMIFCAAELSASSLPLQAASERSRGLPVRGSQGAGWRSCLFRAATSGAACSTFVQGGRLMYCTRPSALRPQTRTPKSQQTIRLGHCTRPSALGRSSPSWRQPRRAEGLGRRTDEHGATSPRTTPSAPRAPRRRCSRHRPSIKK